MAAWHEQVAEIRRTTPVLRVDAAFTSLHRTRDATLLIAGGVGITPIRALLEGERAQGTVEYVGLILLVSLLMVGMVAALKGFNGKQGMELAEVIIEKMKQAVNQVSFR